MILTPFVGLTLYFYFAVLSPIFNLRRRCREDDELVRWLVYFFCLNSVCIPLFLLPWLPMRYELLLAASGFLAVNDARVAQRLIVSCVFPKMEAGGGLAHLLGDPVPQAVKPSVGSSG